MSKYYHAGNGECFLSHQSVGKPAAYCDTNAPIGFLEGCAEGYEVFQFIDKSSHERDWFPCYWKQYDLTHPDLRRIFLTLSSEINDGESTPEGVTAEAVFSKHSSHKNYYAIEDIYAAMHEYASLVSASKDEEIARLKEDVERLNGFGVKIATRFYQNGMQAWAGRFKADRLSNNEDFVEFNKILADKWQQFKTEYKL